MSQSAGHKAEQGIFLHKSMTDKEKEVIAILEINGYKNYKDNADHNRILEFTYADKKYRRFLVEFKLEDYSSLTYGQVRKFEYDENWCNENLKPSIKREGLDFPVMIGNSGRIDHGHNRAWSLNSLYPGKEIPCVVLSPVYEVEELDNSNSMKLASNQSFLKKLSRIKPNTPPKNNHYVKEDIATQFSQLFNDDNKLGGLNPMGTYPARNCGVFDMWMDIVHPAQFTTKGERTKIYNKASEGRSVIMKIQFRDITNAAVNLAWDSGVKLNSKGKPVRKSFPDWKNNDNTITTHISTNGSKEWDKIQPTIWDIAVDMKRGKNTSPTIKGQKLLVHVDNPKSSLLELNKQRRKFVQSKFDTLNSDYNILGYNWALIKEVYFLKQLRNDVNDVGLRFVYNSKTKKLEEK